MADKDLKKLIEKALDMRELSYAPYSHYRVGAALESEDGQIFGGCNVENSSYGAANCAERTAFYKAVSEGISRFRRIVITGGTDNEELQYCSPCGICRQVMREFCDPKTFEIILARTPDDYRIYTLEQLLPESFGPENLL
ncbi:cytidine deaminase [Oribacterium sp. WCC10]|uniref:cytidine deaminase n=1 Tax=Oribacterium sp. WCC10 TaxID=1855343 RepID=UPI0008E4D437|nr:cytidine deaminase [Oribacterium sp. WCC10]SFG54247.1 cytidine deaminase [Oribacterium sp. WCC10]